MSQQIKFPDSPFYRLSVSQYHQMIECGFFAHDERIELLDGYLVEKMPHRPRHSAAILRLQRRLEKILANEHWLVQTQSPITLRGSEPEPDIAVVRGPERIYDSRHPKPNDIGMLVEVAESTLDSDQNWKSVIYARARIQPYWIVNLVDNQIEVHTNPKGGKSPCYRDAQTYSLGQKIPLILDDKKLADIPVNELIPT